MKNLWGFTMLMTVKHACEKSIIIIFIFYMCVFIYMLMHLLKMIQNA